jgi:hypothetical protein
MAIATLLSNRIWTRLAHDHRAPAAGIAKLTKTSPKRRCGYPLAVPPTKPTACVLTCGDHAIRPAWKLVRTIVAVLSVKTIDRNLRHCHSPLVLALEESGLTLQENPTVLSVKLSAHNSAKSRANCRADGSILHAESCVCPANR